jgi:protein-tyrosine phosphatase
MKSILFVCLGNICRSPLADGIANKIAREKDLILYIDSAGTSHFHKGEPPCENSQKVAKKYGVDISGLRSRPIVPKDLEEFDFVIAMDEQNRKDLLSYGFKDVYKLGEFGGLENSDIPDPYYYRGFKGFEIVYEMIEQGVRDLLDKIENKKLEKK